MNNIEKFNEKKAEWNKKRDEMREEGKELLFSTLQELFEKNENLKKIAWTQYTPWFNDGDTCEFHAHIDYPDVNDWQEGDYYEGDEEEDETTKPSDELYKEIVSLLNILDEDDYKEIFGDHVKVTITKEGYEVEGYDHD